MMKAFFGAGFACAIFAVGCLPAQAATVEITIRKLSFGPGMVNAAVGDRIVWSNKDVMDHTATLDGSFDILIPAGGTGTLLLTNAGPIRYHCRYHPNMVGTIEVDAR
jgi:plastocyanin